LYDAAVTVTSQLAIVIVFQFPKKEQPKYTVHDLQVSDQFMQKVIGELDPTYPIPGIFRT
jgi:hypothetical protein